MIYDTIHILQTPNPHSMSCSFLVAAAEQPILPGHSALMQAMAATIRT